MSKFKIIVLSVSALFINACDLARDNPLDGLEPGAGISVKYSSHNVVSDDNNDKKVNRGETVYLKVNLKNEGTRTAKNVKAAFTANDDFTLRNLTVYPAYPLSVDYGDIPAGKEQDISHGTVGDISGSNYTIRFLVDQSIPVGARIEINISVVDGSLNEWYSSFSVKVE